MKLDFELLKEILQEVEEKSDGITEDEIVLHTNLSSMEKKRAYHFRVLVQSNLIEGRILDLSTHDGRSERIYYTGLSLIGHQVLETMNCNGFKEKIKQFVKIIGIESLKQIPAFAIKILKEGL